MEKCDGSNNFSILFNPNLFPAELNCFQTGYSWKTSHADNQYFYWLENNFVAYPLNLGIDWPSLTNCYGGEMNTILEIILALLKLLTFTAVLALGANFIVAMGQPSQSNNLIGE